MLDNAKSQAVYKALQSSSGFASSAANKATAAVAQATSLKTQLDTIIALPDAGGAGAIVPTPIRDAITQLKSAKGAMTNTGNIAAGLSDAIGQRMGDITGNMATMQVAADVAQRMGDVPGGCGALGAAFSVLTSEGRTELLNSLMTGLTGELGGLMSMIEEGLALGTPSIPAEMEAALTAAMGNVESAINQIDAAASSVLELVNESQQMWGSLNKAFNEAIQTSILMNVFDNPCLMAVVDTVAPPEVSDVLNNFKP